jgi:hypothetical protein
MEEGEAVLLFGWSLAVYLWPSSRLTLSGRRRHVEASMMQTNEWALLKRQFDALVHDESGAESIEKIFDVQFSRRFTELINQTAERNSRTGYIDWSRR